MKRREFLKSVPLVACCAQAFAELPRAPRVLLRSSWQVVNIGDIAHTPGVLRLLGQYIPEAEVTLWASGDLSEEVAAMLRRRFPNLAIVKGSIGTDGKASNSELSDAIAWSSFFLHGSGPSLVAAKDLVAFVKHTGKPFGVYGITHGSFSTGNDAELLSQARFVYFRDSVSLARARNEGVTCKVMEYGPDGAFACDLRDDDKASRFLKEHDLEVGKYLCCLSRLRYTPYWTIPAKNRPFDAERHRRNEMMKERDHLELRKAIVAIARQTSYKVLLCPEDATQMAVGREMFWEKLPEDVKPQVVWRDSFWLTDEALSIYVRSAGLFGSEMHSPIMAVGNGVPAIVCRFEEQTSKGFMWRDIGLDDWLFDLDDPTDHPQIVPAVLSLAEYPDRARQKVEKARGYVQQRQRQTMDFVKNSTKTV